MAMGNPSPAGLFHHHGGICQLVIGEDNAAFIDEAVRVQHTCKGLGKYGFAGAGFAYDSDGLAIIDVQIHATDSGQNSTANTEFDFQILNRQ